MSADGTRTRRRNGRDFGTSH